MVATHEQLVADVQGCVHCGICLPKCPTYVVFGEEMDSPRGRLAMMRDALEHKTPGTPVMAKHLDLCLGCRGCETACPSGVPYGSLLDAARATLAQADVHAPAFASRRIVQRFVLFAFSDVERLGRLMRMLRVLQRMGLASAARGLSTLTPFRRLRAMMELLPPVPARGVEIPGFTPARGTRKGKALLHLGCVQRYLFPGVHRATVDVLSAAGYDVEVPASQGCCGALQADAGLSAVAREKGEALIGALGTEADVIVTNAAGCGAALKQYGKHFGTDAAQRFSARVRDVSEVLADADLDLGPLRAKVTYADPCHLIHAQRVRNQPRQVLRRIPGVELIELPDADLCCGSAGIYNVLEPRVGDDLGRRKADALEGTGAAIVVAGNPGCLMQIQRELRRRGSRVEVLHPVELVARALPKDGTAGSD